MSVEEGTVHGFLGPNGAGKSTTIRTLLGLLHPTAGKVRVLGKNPLQHPEILRRVGYVPGDVALWPALTGLETLNALESLRGWTVNRRRPVIIRQELAVRCCLCLRYPPMRMFLFWMNQLPGLIL